MGFFVLMAIPTAMYLAIVVLTKAESADRRMQKRIQRSEDLKQLKW